MKKIVFLLFAVCMTVLTSCKKDDDAPAVVDALSLSTDIKVIESGTFEVEVTASGAWTATCDKLWLRMSTSGGLGNTTVIFTVDAGGEDEATVTFTSGEETVTLTVVRSSDGSDVTYLILSGTNIWKRGSFSTVITVQSTSPWTATCNRSWVTFSPSSGGKGSTNVSISFPDGADDEAVITFKNATHTKKYEITRKSDIPRTSDGKVDYSGLQSNGKVTGGTFSVSSSGKVYFSMGNLQYNASQNKWRFALHQWDYAGGDNSYISSTYNGWIDLFGWGTSGATEKLMPYQTDDSEIGWWYGYVDEDIAGTNRDWGVNNAITNGGNTKGIWRTLKQDEWNYLLYTRSNASKRRGYATVNNVKGFVILPDVWSSYPVGCSTLPTAAGWPGAQYDEEQWYRMMKAGAIFLPAGGYREKTGVSKAGGEGHYWTSSVYYKVQSGTYYMAAHYFEFLPSSFKIDHGIKYMGYNVRLVQNAN